MNHESNCPFFVRRRREYGFRRRKGEIASLQNSLASSTKVHHTWDPKTTINHTDHGGVFNFDFSKDGSVLGVACERKSVLLFDPFSGKMVAHKNNAHTDCVNCVKFLDNRLFATCSDDTAVALWDLRYLKHNIRTFRGHSNWVKNIEYAADQGLLLTSGFDGCIYTWNINSYSEEEASNKVFHTSGLMRSKLSPDSSKLLISTHEGYIIVIHNLDLSTLAEDLKGFKPNMYRLMQRSKTPLRLGLMYNHVFEQEKNRVEFLADWPTGNDANIISSLQIHPQGWCAISRNTDSSENAEWTCIHDIQDSDWKKGSKGSEDMPGITPNTSSAYCSSTYTPAFSSVAPSQRNAQTSSQESDRSRSFTSADEGNAPDHVEEVQPETGRAGSDSLIQIRRGARTGDGQFSFSISVHTASGRTIEFNNTDLEDSDDDEVHVDPSTGVISVNNNRLRQTDPSEDDNDISDNDSDEDFLDNENIADELLPYNNAGANDASDTSAESLEEHMQESNEELNDNHSANSTASPARSSVSQRNVTYITPLTNSPPEISRSAVSSSNTVSQSGGESSAGSVQSTSASQARNNTFMFVLQSNAGRRILNLRYMDSYSERENSILQKKIYTNSKRLIGYAEECNVGRGFIKEVGFSADGRLICSPFGFGLRLFAFDSNCNELCDCVPSSPVKLYEVSCSLAHGNCVVATKFSPTHNLVVSGCLDGKIAFHQPVL